MNFAGFDSVSFAAVASKQRVSIDQFALSNMCKTNAGVEYLDLKTALIKAHEEQRIICPIHADEFNWESAQIPDLERSNIIQLQNSLSDDFRFLNFTEKIALESLHHIEGGFYPRILKCNFDATPAKFKTLKREKLADKEAFESKTGKVFYSDQDKQCSVEDIWRIISRVRADAMLEIIKNFKTGNDTAISTGIGFDQDLAIGVLGYLMEGDNFDIEKIDKLAEFVKCREWERIPTLWFHSRLWGQLEFGAIQQRRKINYSDVLDLLRLAIALDDANVVICDHPMYELLKQAKILKEFPEKKVFSSRQLEDAVMHIKSIHGFKF